MIIERSYYLKFLNKFKDTEFIKVITGVRRSSKTFLMNMFIDQLREEGIPDNRIIHLNFENLKYAKINDYIQLWQYVHDHITEGQRNYLFFDEIQNVKD